MNAPSTDAPHWRSEAFAEDLQRDDPAAPPPLRLPGVWWRVLPLAVVVLGVAFALWPV